MTATPSLIVDPEAGCAYFGVPGRRAARTVQLSDTVQVDLDADEAIIGVELLTLEGIHPPALPQRPERTLPAVTAVLGTCSEPEVVERFSADFTAAWAAACDQGTLTPLLGLVDTWWPAAVMWATDPAGMWRVYQDMRRVERDGLPPYVRAQLAAHPEGMTRERALAVWEQHDEEGTGRDDVPG